MKAWYKESSDAPVRCIETSTPELRPGAAVVEVVAVHVPGYMTAMSDGSEVSLPTPLVLGAGGIGIVRAVADDVFSVALGDVVALDSLVESKDAADPEDIMMGLGEIGGHGVKTDRIRAMTAQWRNGVMAEQAVLPKEAFTRLPGAEHYSEPARLAFLTWLSIAGEGIEQSGQQPGDVVTVLGATGLMGGATVLVALARGAASVVAVGRNPDALERLAALDARVKTVVLAGDREADARDIVAAAGAPQVVIDALGGAPNADITMAGFDALHDGGTMILLGGVRCDVPIPYGELLRRRLTLRGSRMYRPSTVLSVWRMVEAGLIDLSAVDVVPVGLDNPQSAIDRAAGTKGLAFVALVP